MLELANLEDGSRARVHVRFSLALMEELEWNDQERRGMLVRIPPRLIVLLEGEV